MGAFNAQAVINITERPRISTKTVQLQFSYYFITEEKKISKIVCQQLLPIYRLQFIKKPASHHTATTILQKRAKTRFLLINIPELEFILPYAFICVT